MKTFVLACAAVVGLSGPTKADDTSWYVMHLGADICVPLTDINTDASRGYFGSGDANFSTPGDVIKNARQLFPHATIKDVTPKKGAAEGIKIYSIKSPVMQKTMNLVFFSDRDMCKHFVGEMDR